MIARLAAEDSRFNKMSAILPEADFFATLFFLYHFSRMEQQGKSLGGAIGASDAKSLITRVVLPAGRAGPSLKGRDLSRPRSVASAFSVFVAAVWPIPRHDGAQPSRASDG